VDWPEQISQALKQNKVEIIAHVPDEVTGSLLGLLEADPAFSVICVTREEEGVALLAGAYLGGKRGALIFQGSGLGNALNALGSLAVAAQIPILLIISERGRLGEINPVQVPLGRATPQILEALGIQAFWVSAQDEAADVVDSGARLTFSTTLPVAVLLTPALTGGKRWK
jgi:sulfopyruvate decarboxylase alpha subunit